MTRHPNKFAVPAKHFAIAVGLAVSLLTFAKMPALIAQTQQTSQQAPDAALPSFEVASIRPHAADDPRTHDVFMGPPDPSHWVATRVTARTLIVEAYDIDGFQLSGGPPWIDSEHFDVNTKVDDATAAQLQKLTRHEQNQQMDLMLRSLLIERFKLKVTRETKGEQVFALVIAKGGPKFKETTGVKGQGGLSFQNGLVTATSKGVPISTFAAALSAQLGRPVLDQTGLTGRYDISWHYVPQTGLSPNASAADTAGPAILDALQDQLGLKLESTKAPTETITIDHIEEPSPN